MVSIASAAAAYANAAAKGQGPGMAPRQAGGESFADLVKDAVGEAKQTLQEGEHATLAAASGKADLTQVALAVTNADAALQTVIAVRDKVISAYQDILR